MDSSGTASYVIGPDGEKMTVEDLPSPETRRWVPRRKARVVAAVEGGLISEEQALQRYAITPEEYDTWKAAMSKFGMRGLCVTQINRVRATSE
ncbi:MAG: DUF1153 domain-containing protein [Pseudomonadota bacterium]